jgi:hypothetical protein
MKTNKNASNVRDTPLVSQVDFEERDAKVSFVEH